jgi:hypothetical protein
MIPQIQSTRNYNEFKFANFNRDVVDVTVKKLKNEYEKEDNFRYFPIIVDVDMKIIDGQHRFVACRDLGLPIYYIKKNKSVEPTDVRTVNKAGKKHTVQDIFEMECKIQNPEALKIKQLGEELEGKFQLSALLSLVFDTSSGGQVRDKLESGNYCVNNYENSKRLGLLLLQLTENTHVSVTIYNSINAVANKNNIKKSKLVLELIERGLVVNSLMSKTVIVNRIVETYNFKRISKNRLLIP